MNDLTRAVPVQKWVVTLEDPILDEAAALSGWHHFVRAQGWSPVGEPEIIGGSIVGRLVKRPGITVASDIRDAIVLPK